MVPVSRFPSVTQCELQLLPFEMARRFVWIDEKNEIVRNKYYELGLGRGINVTDENMWRNKTTFVVRRVNPTLSNVITTEECGMNEEYEKELSSASEMQQLIKFSLDDPSSQVKIGMDAQHTYSTRKSGSTVTSCKTTKTRTISFRTSFNDLPQYTAQPAHGELTIFEPLSTDDEPYFEKQFCEFILHRINSRKKSCGKDPLQIPADQEKASKLAVMEHLEQNTTVLDHKKVGNDGISKNKKEELDAVLDDCLVFVRDMGITHYVSALELGAMKYSTSTMSSKKKSQNTSASTRVTGTSKGGLKEGKMSWLFQRSKEEKSIGRIPDEEQKSIVRDNFEDSEAVIGFKIQPIHNLILVPYLQPILQAAVKKYVQSKADPTGKSSMQLYRSVLSDGWPVHY